MFERYTEKARRVIFFARYEASQYGSPCIESEHLLLGLAREDKPLIRTVLPNLDSPGKQIREEIEGAIERRERISTSVEMPLTQECKHILNFAAEEAGRLGSKDVGTDHLLLGILREENCVAARILLQHGAVAAKLRERTAANPFDFTLSGASAGQRVYPPTYAARRQDGLGSAVDRFRRAWAARDAKAVADLFTDHGQLWDIHGEQWHSPAQIEKGLAAHFSTIARSEVSPDVRDIKMVTAASAVVTLVWEPQGEAKRHGAAALRMVLVLCAADPQWRIVSAHLASVPPAASAAARQA